MLYFLVVLLSSETRGAINEKGAYYQEQRVRSFIIRCQNRLSERRGGCCSTNNSAVPFILNRELMPSSTFLWNYRGKISRADKSLSFI